MQTIGYEFTYNLLNDQLADPQTH